MPIDEASFRDALSRCGVLTTEAQDAIIDLQGVDGMTTLAVLPESAIDVMAIAISKMPHTPPLFISQVAVMMMKAMRQWTIWQARQGFVLDHDRYDADEADWMLERIHHEECHPSDDKMPRPPALKNLQGWHSFWKQFDSYCQQVRGQMSLPVAYVYRKHVEVTQEMLDKTDYLNSDLQLMDLVELEGRDYMSDNEKLWGVFSTLVMDGTAWPFIKKFESSKNGRAAILALKGLAEGKASDTTRKSQARSTLRNLQYTGLSGKMTFDSYVEKLQFAFSELQDCAEVVDESQKVDHLLQGLKSDLLSSPASFVMGDERLLNDFEATIGYLKSIIAKKSAYEHGGSRNERGISEAAFGEKKTKKRNENNEGYLSKEAWFALSPSERAERIKQRAASSSPKKRAKTQHGQRAKKSVKAYKREIKALKAKVAASASKDLSSDEDSEPEPAAKASVAHQFGRQAKKVTNKKK